MFHLPFCLLNNLDTAPIVPTLETLSSSFKEAFGVYCSIAHKFRALLRNWDANTFIIHICPLSDSVSSLPLCMCVCWSPQSKTSGESTGICSWASFRALDGTIDHQTLPVWTLQIISHLTPGPTNHLSSVESLEYWAGCCLKHKRKGRVAAERAGSFLPVMRSSRDLTLSLESSGVQTIQHPLGMSKYQSVPRKINYSDEGGSSYFLEGWTLTPAHTS